MDGVDDECWIMTVTVAEKCLRGSRRLLKQTNERLHEVGDERTLGRGL